MRLLNDSELPRTRLELTPIMDIVFLTLVFFVYAMMWMVVHRGVMVDLPTSSSAPIEQKPFVSVTLDDNDTLYVNQQPTPLADLGATVVSARGGETEQPVFVRGGATVQLQRVMEVMDQLRDAGIAQVYFEATSPK